MILIAAIGRQAAGKGELAELARKKGFEVIKFRDIVVAEAERRKADHGPMTLILVGDQMRKESGLDVVARGVEKKIRESRAKKIFLEGMRSEEERVYLKTRFPTMKVIAVVADEKTRTDRVMKRKRHDDPITAEDMRRKEAIEHSWGVDSAVKNADYLIENTGTEDAFRTLASKTLEKIMGEADG